MILKVIFNQGKNHGWLSRLCSWFLTLVEVVSFKFKIIWRLYIVVESHIEGRIIRG